MKLQASDPDIQTIVRRIREKELDLQPDFQRGEVWSDSKRRKLIDTILRNWHVPPIHVIERSDSHKQEVLDGQQRLAAIRDFVDGVIRVDGHIEPYEPEIAAADNCTYETLPLPLRRRFDRFTLRVFSLVDFKAEEPGELFYRLNQNVSLTAAEQRNAFFGPVRGQVRRLCEAFPSFNLTEDFIGFSNSRMAHDDTVAKVCLSLERRSIAEKISAATITERYRKAEPFDENVIGRVESALRLLGKCNAPGRPYIKFNKATLLSWLCFMSRVQSEDHGLHASEHVPGFVWAFEQVRNEHAYGRRSEPIRHRAEFPAEVVLVFNDRASLRVADVSSVLLRDGSLNYCFVIYLQHESPQSLYSQTRLRELYNAWHGFLSAQPVREGELLYALEQIKWGRLA